MFSIELLDAQTGDRKTNAEVCFTESNGFQKYVQRDEAHDRGFKQLFIAFGIASSEEDYERKFLKKINFNDGQYHKYKAAKCIMVNKECGVTRENLHALAKTIQKKRLEDELVIWREYRKIKAQSSTEAGKYGTVGSMGYASLEKPDDDNSCCAIM